MPRNPNYLKMQEMGSWLEKLLAPDKENWRWKEIFKEGVGILNLYYTVPDNHPFFDYLDGLSGEKGKINYFEVERNLAKAEGLLSETGNIEKVYLFGFHLEVIFKILKSINNSTQPWNVTLAKVIAWNATSEKNKVDTQREKLSSLPSGELISHRDSVDEIVENFTRLLEKENRLRDILIEEYLYIKGEREQISLEVLDYLYSQVGEKLIINDDGVQKVNVILSNNYNAPIEYTTSEDKSLPFPIISGRIFFDFLILGGQEYIGFCQNENCGRFMMVQRKGRKKFCSDKCRLEHFHSNKDN